MEDHKDLCAGNKFGINNFGLDRAVLSMSNIRCDAGLCLSCAISHNKLLCFMYFTERHDNNDEACLCFEE